MPAFKDLSGMQFGRWTVIEQASPGNCGQVRWNCECECGSKKVVFSASLISGRSNSCGCFHKQTMSEIHKVHGQSRRSMRTQEYSIWASMLQRCTNPNHKNYEHYGGRGISVCQRWRTFDLFYADVGDRPSVKHSIERIDVNKGYEPSNVKWATDAEQSRNRRDMQREDIGVHWENYSQKWRARITVNNRSIGLGRYSDKEEAVRARKAGEIKYWGKESS